ncbi:ATP-dependent RNA helicase DHX37/DHR1 [Paragonimus westermani]|uniref:RNA helicase n=1 Tax=Paragonimus westermani TaxID=34504 RepID=A0A5J4NES3_9TREM|nr:ATP-dependent RNA helicase DHX37/DHR1 [Paragonimus westermani]
MDQTTDSLISFKYDPNRYDHSNPLVLPEKSTNVGKREGQRKRKEDTRAMVLSKKKRKELERKVAQKEKKLTRAQLWKELEGLNKTSENEPQISVLPLFKRTKKLPKPKNDISHGLLRGKAWENVSHTTSDESQSTDDYSSGEDSGPKGPPLPSDCSVEKSVEQPVTESRTSADDMEQVTAPIVQRLQPSRFVLVSRTMEVIASRLTLPIIADEASIMEAVSQHDCVVICGTTGCGKTTQVPQFLYEAGFTKDGYLIGITEPRRVAAISMSKRVGKELNLSSSQVSYHIRYEKTVAQETEIKFMTDGVLLQEVKQDFELSRYSTIIVDEAHERSIYTDVLLGLLSMIMRLRRIRHTDGRPTRGKILPPLKLIIMSATLRVTDFSENRRLFPEALCSPPPVIHVESRQFPVTCHFSKVTEADYLKAAFRKVLHIHKNAPAGGILVFLTGQREVLTLCSWLSRACPVTQTSINVVAESQPDKQRKWDIRGICSKVEDSEPELIPDESLPVVLEDDLTISRINLNNFDIIPMDEEAELGKVRRSHCATLAHSRSSATDDVATCEPLDTDKQSESDWEEIDEDDEVLQEISTSRKTFVVSPIRALPLYSLLSPERQQLVFEAPPEGHRLVVVATNVAETSLTIPNIRYVVDSGKVKTKVYDPATGASCFEITWINQASAEQRAGRAGRVAPGQCHRLYSSQVFSNMRPFATPDILTRPIDEVVLMLKSYLGSTPLSRFPLPTSPSPSAIEFAERRLVTLGALEELYDGSDTFRTISRAGRWMARLPLPARFARMLLFANQHELMPYAVVLVSALSVPDLYASKRTDNDEDNDGDSMDAAHQAAEQSALEQFRTNFAQQFVRRGDDVCQLIHRRPFSSIARTYNVVVPVILFRTFRIPTPCVKQPVPESAKSTVIYEYRCRCGASYIGRIERQLRTRVMEHIPKWVKKQHEDLYLGDLAVLLGTICCLERYSAQLTGLVPAEQGLIDACGGSKRVSRDPDGALRFLVERCGVRWNAYKEVRQLRRQLTNILNANDPDLCLGLDLVLPRPTLNQVNQLRQLFLVGSPCNVASKFDVPVEGLSAKDRRRLRFAYKVPGISGPVFIDPNSPLSRENCPYLAFLELHRTSKPFLRNVCAIDPQWIPFLAPHNYRVEGVILSEDASQTITTTVKAQRESSASSKASASTAADELDSIGEKKKQSVLQTIPTPRYDREHDTIVTGAKTIYYVGTCASQPDVDDNDQLELPNFSMLIPLNDLAAARSLGNEEVLTWSVRWFGRYILDGIVFPDLSSWFPRKVKQGLSITLMTVSWGIPKLYQFLATDGMGHGRRVMYAYVRSEKYASLRHLFQTFREVMGEHIRVRTFVMDKMAAQMRAA